MHSSSMSLGWSLPIDWASFIKGLHYPFCVKGWIIVQFIRQMFLNIWLVLCVTLQKTVLKVISVLSTFPNTFQYYIQVLRVVLVMFCVCDCMFIYIYIYNQPALPSCKFVIYYIQRYLFRWKTCKTKDFIFGIKHVYTEIFASRVLWFQELS